LRIILSTFVAKISFVASELTWSDPTELLEIREAIQRLIRKRFQSGSVRLRKDRGEAAYWQGFCREEVVTEAGKIERKRRYANPGSLKDVPSKKAARQELAVILEPIDDFNQSSKRFITFREFIENTAL